MYLGTGGLMGKVEGDKDGRLRKEEKERFNGKIVIGGGGGGGAA